MQLWSSQGSSSQVGTDLIKDQAAPVKLLLAAHSAVIPEDHPFSDARAVEPLAEADAKLLVKRLLRDHALGDNDAANLASACQRIPLTIHIAAAKLRMKSLAASLISDYWSADDWSTEVRICLACPGRQGWEAVLNAVAGAFCRSQLCAPA